MGFHFEKLDAVGVAVDMLVCVDALASDLPPGRGYIRDHIRRSSNSVVLNLAEGAGEYSPAEKARFYRMAKRSATETAAQLMVMERLDLVDDSATARVLLERVVHARPNGGGGRPPSPSHSSLRLMVRGQDMGDTSGSGHG